MQRFIISLIHNGDVELPRSGYPENHITRTKMDKNYKLWAFQQHLNDHCGKLNAGLSGVWSQECHRGGLGWVLANGQLPSSGSTLKVIAWCTFRRRSIMLGPDKLLVPVPLSSQHQHCIVTCSFIIHKGRGWQSMTYWLVQAYQPKSFGLPQRRT